jgi:glyoxylase-like metal-dependent hydrolase (beta-lactamase superfamily II)
MQANLSVVATITSGKCRCARPGTSFAFKKFTDVAMEYFQNVEPTTIDVLPQADHDVRDRLETKIGGRRFELSGPPGGETTDSLVVWLPDDEVVFTGNTFGPLFVTYRT